MEMDNNQCSSSDEESEMLNKKDGKLRHSAVVRLDLDAEDIAEAVLRVVSVDKEPSRSSAVRTFCLDGRHLQIEIAAVDRKSLQKSLANVFDMCDLAKSTIDFANQRKCPAINGPIEKKQKLNCLN